MSAIATTVIVVTAIAVGTGAIALYITAEWKAFVGVAVAVPLSAFAAYYVVQFIGLLTEGATP